MMLSAADYHIVILEDEPTLREDMLDFLSAKGFVTTAVATLREFHQTAAIKKIDLVLLDINLPDGNGFDIAKDLRASGNIGIVMLTSRGCLDDRLTGLDCGADAYLVKHADLREIEATIWSVLRRFSDHSSKSFWNYNRISWQLTAPNGTYINLTATEAVLIRIILENLGMSTSRDDIAAALPRPTDGSDRSLDSMVKRLRKKVAAETGMELPVSVVYGIGYSFTARAKIT